MKNTKELFDKYQEADDAVKQLIEAGAEASIK